MLAWALGARAAPAPYVIETEFEPARAYVGAEVTLRLRLLRNATQRIATPHRGMPHIGMPHLNPCRQPKATH